MKGLRLAERRIRATFASVDPSGLVVEQVPDLHSERTAVDFDPHGDCGLQVLDLVAQGDELLGLSADALLEHSLHLAVGSFEPEELGTPVAALSFSISSVAAAHCLDTQRATAISRRGRRSRGQRAVGSGIIR
ncbi:hypothetical protein GCM10009789_38950 [Kribbella sancticallisti]|uniref:DUF2283 domain-containing protein n=1 Tax=Kribbella sancticallisti TaxID=460087 RepID=A0ABN2DN66_9ACTN